MSLVWPSPLAPNCSGVTTPAWAEAAFTDNRPAAAAPAPLIAEDDGEKCPIRPYHGHVVLQLRHVALDHFLGVCKGVGVLRFPDCFRLLDEPIERAAPPVVPLTLKGRADSANTLASHPLEPLAVK